MVLPEGIVKGVAVVVWVEVWAAVKEGIVVVVMAGGLAMKKRLRETRTLQIMKARFSMLKKPDHYSPCMDYALALVSCSPAFLL
jgi:hypothetical protein